MTNRTILLGNIRPANNDKIHQRNYVYDPRGVCPTETATQYKDPIRVLVVRKRVDA